MTELTAADGNRGVLEYIATDQLGSPIATVTGNAVTRRRFLPYGGLRSQTGAGPVTDLGFTGQIGDRATGLNYFNARYQAPLTATFTQPDTVAIHGDLNYVNRYAYVGGDPINRIDPTGHAYLIGRESTGGGVTSGWGDEQYWPPPRGRNYVPAPDEVTTTTFDAPVMNLGTIHYEARIVNVARGLPHPDGVDPTFFRFRVAWDTDAGMVQYSALPSCAGTCERPIAVSLISGNVGAQRGSSIRFDEIEGGYSMTVNARANGPLMLPGNFPGGITGTISLTNDHSCECLATVHVEHDRYPKHIVSSTLSGGGYRYNETPTWARIPFFLSPAFPNASGAFNLTFVPRRG